MHAGQVLVYQYCYWDEGQQARIPSDTYATIMAIRDGLGTPLFETAKWVPASDVEGGIYHPKHGARRRETES